MVAGNGSKEKTEQPKPCAGNLGTIITVEDMFYNIPIRQKALKNTSEEYNRIVEVVQRYAIHNSSVAFICKKMGSSQSDVHSTKSSQLDTIRAIYGNALATELVEFHHSQADYNVNGWISNPNYSLKKREFILFINNGTEIE